MNRSQPTPAAEAAIAAGAVMAAWAVYLPLGMKYAAAVTLAAGALLILHAGPGWRGLRQQPGLPLILLLLALLAASITWSIAPWPRRLTNLALYGLTLLVPLIAATCPPDSATRALKHFAAASGLVGLLFVVDRSAGLPMSRLWATTLAAEGNQRICNSLMLALGAGMAAWLAAAPRAGTRARAAWAAAGVFATIGLALQDRRSGMLVLPLLALAWALARQPTTLRRLTVAAAVATAVTAGWFLADGVRARFAEGVAELRSDPGDPAAAATSWGQRRRMLQITLGMVAERPLAGHGIASWEPLWRARTPEGSALQANTTPHNEYLLLAQQGGLAAPLLLLALLATGLRRSYAAGRAGVPALMVWLTIGVAGLFNAVLRDAKFSLALLSLAGLAGACLAARPRGADDAGP